MGAISTGMIFQREGAITEKILLLWPNRCASFGEEPPHSLSPHSGGLGGYKECILMILVAYSACKKKNLAVIYYINRLIFHHWPSSKQVYVLRIDIKTVIQSKPVYQNCHFINQQLVAQGLLSPFSSNAWQKIFQQGRLCQIPT